MRHCSDGNSEKQEQHCGDIQEYQKENLRGMLLELALELKRICETYKLAYFMHAGTLLGAVRHKGFIPLDCLGEKREAAWKKQDQYACIHYLKHHDAKWKWICRLGWYRRQLYRIKSKIFSDRYLVDKLRSAFLTEGYLSEFEEQKWCVASNECMGNYRHIALKQEWYQSQVMMQFEGEIFPAPAGYKEILSLYYGDDYMEYPPERLRKGHHFPVMSTEISYKEYLKPFRDIFKNTKGKTIVVFGAGEMLRHYLKHTKRSVHPVFVVDNDPGKWGKKQFHIPVKEPETVLKVPPEQLHMIICSIHYREITKQLERMGVKEYYIYVQNVNWL